MFGPVYDGRAQYEQCENLYPRINQRHEQLRIEGLCLLDRVREINQEFGAQLDNKGMVAVLEKMNPGQRKTLNAYIHTLRGGDKGPQPQRTQQNVCPMCKFPLR